MKKIVSIVVVILLTLTLFAGCGAQNAGTASADESAAATTAQSAASEESTAQSGTSDEALNIVYLAPSKDIQYWQWVEAGVKQACEEIGANLVTYDAQNSVSSQQNNCNTAITQEVDGIVLSPVSSPSCTPVLDAAEAAGIPVTIAAIGPDEGVENYACLVTADDYTSGYENGLFLCEKVLAAGGGTIGVLSLPLDRSNAQQKMAGLEKACEEKGIEICQVLQTQDLTVNTATQQANDLMTANPDMKGIYGMYEQAGIGAVAAVETSGAADNYTIVSSDGSPESIAMIREGKIAGIVVQEAVGQGLVATQELIKAIKGEEITEKNIPLPEPLVTTENVDDPDIQEILKLVYPASAGSY
ncbi:MAG: substrate-binding domain-containing protein [Christensenella sp.]|nr:substrate-binding domain-containing protein [Christensenella sp.]